MKTSGTGTAEAGTGTAEAPAAPARTRPESGSTELAPRRGKTSVADGVVQKIAGIAAREVSGVYRLGGGAARAFGAIRERIPGSGGPNVAQGVSVEVGERQAAVDLELVVEYGVAIPDLAASVRKNVISAVERMTGLEVTEVNIAVDDIHLPGDEEDEEQTAREPSRVH